MSSVPFHHPATIQLAHNLAQDKWNKKEQAGVAPSCELVNISPIAKVIFH